ncbi:MAG: family 2 glycosyl [Geobacteraceae bacterium]|nr:MAG: family 2 glycosyl [Geobacteraceae bacterium]
MKRYYCTYFDRNYLIKALALIKSLNAHEKNEFHLFAVCLDEITRIILEKLAPLNVTVIPLHRVEQGDEALASARQNRSQVEYYWTLTPTVILWLFEQFPAARVLTYLDADLYFYSSPDPIIAEFADRSIMIHEHRFSPGQAHMETHGKYNVGLLCFRRDGNGMEALKWWRERCIEWCYARVEDGKFGDQLYLNDWPERFKGLRVLENIGAGVAPWNQEQYAFTVNEQGLVMVNDTPLVFYHFHGLTFVTPDVVIPVKYLQYTLTEELLHLVFLPYIQAMTEAAVSVRAIQKEFTDGMVNQNSLADLHTFLARHHMAETIRKFATEHAQLPLNDEWDYYASTHQYRPTEGDDPWDRSAGKLNDLGKQFWEQGEKKRGLEYFAEAFAIEPDDPESLDNLAAALKSLKLLDQNIDPESVPSDTRNNYFKFLTNKALAALS